MTGLEGLTAEQSGQWLRVAWFLLQLVIHRREERDLVDEVVEQARQSKFGTQERITTMGLSIAEQWKAEGEAKATRLALRTVLTARFGALPAAVEAALVAASVATMTRWLRRAATAATLEEVGIRRSRGS
jgi:hypothetical protein